MSKTTYVMTTTHGVRYELDENGAVLDRSDGPKGWDYRGRWVILGAATRHHSQRVVSLADIVRDGVPGQGWIHDLDHGTHRAWGSDRMRSLRKVTA